MRVDTDAGWKTLALQATEWATASCSRRDGAGARTCETVARGAGAGRVHAVRLDMAIRSACVWSRSSTAILAALGPALPASASFPTAPTSRFAVVEARDRVRILIWERGVGPTPSSGTGACASAVAAPWTAALVADIDVEAPGGTQRVEWRDDGVYPHRLGRGALRRPVGALADADLPRGPGRRSKPTRPPKSSSIAGAARSGLVLAPLVVLRAAG